MNSPIKNKVTGSTVYVKEGEPIERALRRFKNKISDSKLLETLREKEFYTKPTTDRKRKKSAAKSRWQKQLRDQQLPKKMY
jgi:small subunit ribosomal protein S21